MYVHLHIFAIFSSKGDNLNDFLFASQGDETIPKRGLFFKRKNLLLPIVEYILSLKIYPQLMREAKLKIIASPDDEHIT